MDRALIDTAFLKDRQFWAALAAALPFWGLLYFLHPPVNPAAIIMANPWPLLLVSLVYPVLEEIIFRGALQGWLQQRLPAPLPKPFAIISKANLLTSLAFASLHVVLWQSPWSTLVVLPSLVYGYFRERSGGLAAPIALHAFYNCGYYLLTAG